jgi:hypothetical protein
MTTIDAATAESLAEDADGYTVNGWTRMTVKDGDTGRWRQHHTLVLRNEADEFWGLDYASGLTEYQDHEYPWRDVPDDEPLKLTRLYPHTVTTVEYRTKPAEVTA